MTHRRTIFSALATLTVLIIAVFASTFGGGSVAQTLTSAAPQTVGFSPERLARLDAVMHEYVDGGRVAGVVTLVARHGREVQLNAYGAADRENNVPMRSDTIFRLASTTKLVTTV